MDQKTTIDKKSKDKVWILGPCSMENRELYFSTFSEINNLMDGRDWYYKASFDKANRTSIVGGRGPGLEEGIEIFKDLKKQFPGVRLLTDVHETWQVEKLEEVIDCIQIPAFLCRQTDLIVECAKAFDKINIKKGQWLGPNNLVKSIDKVKDTNSDCEAWICDRGTNFGYTDLFVNFGIVDELKEHYDKVILDCTHSIQRSREVYGSQGDRNLAERYLVAADVFGYDGVFAEVHPDPPSATSDGDCQLYLKKLSKLIRMSDEVGFSSRGLYNGT
jgi:2-dehydro-3-deoxyphosphooctonate aldolase (KDO 8-P synthase)